MLVTFPPPQAEEVTEGLGCCEEDTDAGAGRSLAARSVFELRFSLDRRVWLVLARGVGRGRVVEEVLLGVLLGVLGMAKSSSWKPLKVES